LSVFDKLETYEEILASPRTFIENFCYITTKDGKFELFKLNYPQNKLMDLVEEGLREKKPIRIRVLKARQMGFSTLISALGFWWSAMNENSAYAVVAHKDSSASSIFEKNKIFYDNLPSVLRPKTNRFNSERISFSIDGGGGLRSKIFFGTAGGGELFRGETILFLHKSEIAFWEDKTGTLKKSLNATVPYAPFSCIIEETTANGYNEFKDSWDRSVRGDDDYTPLFVGWNEMVEYAITPPQGFQMSEKELQLQMEYDLSDAQIFWRRIKINNDYDGNELWFQQEYPLTPEEAFIASGMGVFDSDTIRKGYLSVRPPIEEREIQSVMVKERIKIWEYPEVRDEVEYNQLVRYNEDMQDYEYYNGDIEVSNSKVYANYTLAVDTSGLGADYNQLVVWHNINKTMVARFGIKNINEEKLAKIVVEIAQYYNNSMVVAEVNYSHAIYDYILELGYNNCYYTENTSRIDKMQNNRELGFKTTKLTKAPIISSLRALLNEKPDAIPDKDFWYETEYYVMQDVATNRMNAVSGHHDDIIMANAIGFYTCNSFQAKQTYSRKIEKHSQNHNKHDIIGIGIFDRPKEKTKKLKRGVYSNNA
jgi:hypothetical protein